MTSRHRWCAGLTALAVLALAIAVATAVAGTLTWPAWPMRLRSSDPLRAALLAVALAAALVGVGWTVPRWRRAGIGVLILDALILLALSARHAAPQFPTADAAFIELYTRHALYGWQLLGPYSQFGWFHPGPMLFYWLAAFYAVGGHSMNSINTGALAANLVSLGVIAWVGLRQGPRSAASMLVLWCLVALFAVRVSGLFASAWNPHAPVVPLMALLFVGAAVATGDAVLLPILILLASFIVQSHIGFAPTASFVAGAGVAGLAFHAWRDADARRRAAPWMVLSVVLLEVVWLLPIAEQLASRDGNMTRIVRYFFGDEGAPQTWRAAWTVWSDTITSAFRPGFQVPIGHPLAIRATGRVPVGGPLLALALLASAVSFGRRRPYERTLALICLGAALVGLWSVLRVRSLIGDYHVFWLSVIGLVGVGLVISAVLTRIGLTVPARFMAALGALVPVVVILSIGATAVVRLQRERVQSAVTGENLVARRLVDLLRAELPAVGRKPLIRLDPATWGVGAGVILQLDKGDDMFGVDELAELFGGRLAATGTEDALVLICGPDRHAEFTRDRRVRTLGSIGGGRDAVYADAVSLADAPEYRHW